MWKVRLGHTRGPSTSIPNLHHRTPASVRSTSTRRSTLKRLPARAAIKADPKYSNAHALLGMSMQQTGDIPGARAALTEATRLDKKWEPLLAKLPPIPVTPP